jgi:DNA-binding beta-propeller fold protein YncE
MSISNGVAVSRDGRSLFVSSGGFGGSDDVCEYRLSDGAMLRATRPPADPHSFKFRSPCQLWVAPDGVVFVADACNSRIVAMAPDGSLLRVVPTRHLRYPVGVCANADVVVVSDHFDHSVSVFHAREGVGDGTAIARLRLGSQGSAAGFLRHPYAVCFAHGERHVAVADSGNDRVSVFRLHGIFKFGFVACVGVGVLKQPCGVACSAFDELVVADTDHSRVCIFGDDGVVLRTLGLGRLTGVGVHGCSVFAQDCNNGRFVVPVWS